LSFYDFAKSDFRFHDAYNNLDNKIKNDILIPENPHKAWSNFDYAKKGHSSEIGTRRWIEIKNNIKTIKMPAANKRS
jgi:hypothetical protein